LDEKARGEGYGVREKDWLDRQTRRAKVALHR
jgi:hypothetical protein